MFTLSDNGVLEVVLWATDTVAGQMRLVFQLRLLDGGPLSFADIVADIDEWLSDFVTNIKSLATDEVSFDGFSFNTLDDNYASGFIPFITPQTGTGTGANLPTGVAALLYMPTGVARRQLRKYFFGMGVGALDADGLLTTTSVTDILSIAPFLLTQQVLTNGVWQYGHARPGEGASWVTPESASVSVVPAYQRRRKQGRGI